MKNDDCKPCPFCGHEAEVVENSHGHKGTGEFTATYRIGCPACKIGFVRESTFHLDRGIPVFTRNGYEEAKTLWNQRSGGND